MHLALVWDSNQRVKQGEGSIPDSVKTVRVRLRVRFILSQDNTKLFQ